MSKNEDALLNDIELIPEDAEDKELKKLLRDTLVKLGGIEEEIESIKNLVTQQKLVKKNGEPKKKPGRKKCIMYYCEQEVTEEYLRYLKYDMEVSIAKILDDFYYVTEKGYEVRDREECRGYLGNRLKRR